MSETPGAAGADKPSEPTDSPFSPPSAPTEPIAPQASAPSQGFEYQAPQVPPAAPFNQQPNYQQAPPQQGYYQQPYQQPYAAGGDAKSKIAAGLLGIFLGSLGIHNFYLGYIGKAVAQLLITVLSLGILSFVSFVWGLIEGILILTGSQNFRTDARGVPLRD
ncbi:TM2 domain-containing protein [Psychromicrobium sp. YIM B11713]|uniref:TM2 domain-containing protein n=1 Tax=Psychromicrobium sp. YIM B11713 TaxID=3145233 RepID=UPI00374EC620